MKPINKIAILFDESRSFDIFSKVCKEMGIEVMKKIPVGIKTNLKLETQLDLIKKELNKFKPDLISAWQLDILRIISKNQDGFNILHDFLSDIHIPKSIILQEDPGFVSIQKLYSLTCLFDYIFTHSIIMKDKYIKDGVKKVFYRPCFYYSDGFKLTENAKSSKRYDISFIGRLNPDRAMFIDKIKKEFHGLNIFVGEVWDKKDIIKIYNNSKINLVYGMKSDIEGLKGDGYPMKILEILASKGFALCESRCRLKEDFINGEELVMFNNSDDCIKKIIYFLNHEEERCRIATKGHEKVINCFKDTDGYKEMINKLKINL
jgi:hypothetical protein